ncbi:hypothetical protein [Capnocytophaga stomatis]|uniref:hypothetical protein n=1 Tax=Capnocytophaga stomatis TaxID=1848904 RepID=UPI0012FF717E|nr:hypothetical protein [Capnocytophaga stomatis]
MGLFLCAETTALKPADRPFAWAHENDTTPPRKTQKNALGGCLGGRLGGQKNEKNNP